MTLTETSTGDFADFGKKKIKPLVTHFIALSEVMSATIQLSSNCYWQRMMDELQCGWVLKNSRETIFFRVFGTISRNCSSPLTRPPLAATGQGYEIICIS